MQDRQTLMTNSKANTSKNGPQRQLRKVAILVASLDKPLAERLLAGLPAREEAAVYEIIEHLEDIDPAEQQAVLDDFQKSIALSSKPKAAPKPALSTRTKLEGVELDASLLARIADEGNSYTTPSTMSTNGHSASPWQALSDADATTLVEILSAEQPQTIAVVLSRLETLRSAEIIARLTPTLQVEVLARLSDLDPADEQTLEVVASQLAQWLNAQRQRQQRMAAGQELVQRILQDTPENQRAVLLAQLGKRNPTLAAELTADPPKSPPAATLNPRRSVATAYQPTPNTQEKLTSQTTQSANLLSDPLLELEALDEQRLLLALRQADRQTVMLALAGAGESLMKRIVKGLPRRKANQFRQQVRAVGPTRLSDIVAAQHKLLRCSHESRAQIEIDQ